MHRLTVHLLHHIYGKLPTRLKQSPRPGLMRSQSTDLIIRDPFSIRARNKIRIRVGRRFVQKEEEKNIDREEKDRSLRSWTRLRRSSWRRWTGWGRGRRALKRKTKEHGKEGKNRRSCKESRREGEVFSITWLAVRVCVDPGGFRETKRVITRPRASAVPSNPLTHSPTPRAERLSSLSPSFSLALHRWPFAPYTYPTIFRVVLNKHSGELTDGRPSVPVYTRGLPARARARPVRSLRELVWDPCHERRKVTPSNRSVGNF